MPTPQEIITFCDDQAPPGASPYLPGQAPTTDVAIVPHDPAWTTVYEQLAAELRAVLGAGVLALEHVGSTSIPGLDAKPIIDIDLTVADNNDEPAYVPLLTQQGFTHLLREPWWYGHRLLIRDDPRANLHVWSPDCPEAARHVIFRDWLTSHPDDRLLYVDAKRQAAEQINAVGGTTNDYNAHKQAVIREIYARAFAALGLASAVLCPESA